MADPKAIFEDVEESSANGDEVSNILEAQPGCLKCGEIQQQMKCCTRCHSAYYCSRACFVSHWSVHKKTCCPRERIQELDSAQEIEAANTDKMRYRVEVKPPLKQDTSSVPFRVNFQKAAKDLSAAESVQDNKASIDSCSAEAQDDSTQDLPGCQVQLRYNKQKHKLKILDSWDGKTIFKKISSFLVCLPHHMKLIHKGKQLTVDTVRAVVSPGAVFQVLAEKMEDEEGLEVKDIELLMQQMGLERNVAVRALKSCKGDLIDAMMFIGNK